MMLCFLEEHIVEEGIEDTEEGDEVGELVIYNVEGNGGSGDE